jgi:peptidyl-prolyl cis-trans isomerase C
MKLLLLTAALLLTIFNTTAEDDPTVATVNGVKIRKSLFDKTFTQNLLFVSNQSVTREKVLNDLINRILGIQRAKSNRLQYNPEVKYKMEDILYHAQISKDLEPRFKKIVVTDDEVKDYYSKFNEYRTAQILFRVRANPDKEEEEKAQEQAFKVYDALKKKPNMFAELANRYSQSKSAPNGGDMGFQPAVQLAPEYFKAINGKSVGHITTPVRSQYGYHIIKVLAVKDYDAINTTFYKKVVYDRKRDKVLADYFQELRKNAKVDIDKKYLK